MDYQEIITYGLLVFAVAYLIKKFFWKKSRKKNNDGGSSCGSNCGCS